jgi:hypothetical protein
MPHKLHRPLTRQLAGHIRVHAQLPESSQVRVYIPDPSADGIAVGSFHTVMVEKQLPVFAAPASHFALKGISSAKESSSWLLLKSAASDVLIAHMTGTLAKPQIERVSSGKTATALQCALAEVGRSALRRRNLRLIRVNGVHCLALWVHSERKPVEDVFYPPSPNFAGLRVGTRYSLKRFESAFRKNASEGVLRWFIHLEKEGATRKRSPQTTVASIAAS